MQPTTPIISDREAAGSEARADEIHVAHLISNLGLGGAENSLATLVQATAGLPIRHTVISMMSGGALSQRLEAGRARVIELRSRRGALGALQAGAIRRAIAEARADLVQCWMYHANFAASALQATGRLKGPVLWGVRQGLKTLKLERKSTQALIVGAIPLSRLPARIIYNSEQAAGEHERLGYRSAARVVIENGTDCERFKPRAGAKEALCAQLGVPADTEIIGRVARFAPMKDFTTLMESFAIVAAQRPKARLVVIGPSNGEEQQQLLALADAHRCRDRVFAVPRRLDIENFYAGLDLAVSSSSANEGFPNAVAEALAAGVLVVSTNVGASLLIRNACQRIVERHSPLRLATEMIDLLNVGPEMRANLSARGRQFIEENFGTDVFADRFHGVWREVVRSSRR